MNTMRNPIIAVVTAAAFALTSVGVAPAFAANKPAPEVQTAQVSDSTEFSSRRRHYRGHRGNAAGAAAFAAIIGGIATYAAAREYRKAHERRYNHHYGYGHAPYGYKHRGYYRYY